jgi:hypothetical protein
MEENIAHNPQYRYSNELAQFEMNARQKNMLTDEIKDAVGYDQPILTGVDFRKNGSRLTDLSPAEKIVQAVSEYVGVMKRQGKDATTLLQLRKRGLIDAAETAMASQRQRRRKMHRFSEQNPSVKLATRPVTWDLSPCIRLGRIIGRGVGTGGCELCYFSDAKILWDQSVQR